MIGRIEVIEEAGDGLSTAVWSFSFVDPRLLLRSYLVQTRESKRHKFVTDLSRSWALDNQRAYRLQVRDVPIPADLPERAMAALLREIETSVSIDLRGARPATPPSKQPDSPGL